MKKEVVMPMPDPTKRKLPKPLRKLLKKAKKAIDKALGENEDKRKYRGKYYN